MYRYNVVHRNVICRITVNCCEKSECLHVKYQIFRNSLPKSRGLRSPCTCTMLYSICTCACTEKQYVHWVCDGVLATDEPDRELNCVGHWMEDMKSYLITYDEEDATTPFRCWVSCRNRPPGPHHLMCDMHAVHVHVHIVEDQCNAPWRDTIVGCCRCTSGLTGETWSSRGRRVRSAAASRRRAAPDRKRALVSLWSSRRASDCVSGRRAERLCEWQALIAQPVMSALCNAQKFMMNIA